MMSRRKGRAEVQAVLPYVLPLAGRQAEAMATPPPPPPGTLLPASTAAHGNPIITTSPSRASRSHTLAPLALTLSHSHPTPPNNSGFLIVLAPTCPRSTTLTPHVLTTSLHPSPLLHMPARLTYPWLTIASFVSLSWPCSQPENLPVLTTFRDNAILLY